MEPSSFPFRQPEDVRYSQEAQILSGYKDTLERIRHLLLFEVDLRTIQKADIDMLESQLREIIKGTEMLRRSPVINQLLDSVDAVQTKIIEAIDSLYLASDSHSQRHTVNGRKLFYRYLRQCQQFLFEAIEQFTESP